MTSILKVDSIQNAAGKPILNSTGAVLQVVQQIYDTPTNTTSSTYADTGVTMSITPSSTSSKILVLGQLSLGNTSGDENNNVQLLRGSTVIRIAERIERDSSTGLSVSYNAFTFLDSPSTTNATTYKFQYRTSGGALRINDYDGTSGNSFSSITLIEIAG